MAGCEEPQGERLSVDRKQRIEDEKIEGAWELELAALHCIGVSEFGVLIMGIVGRQEQEKQTGKDIRFMA